MDLRFLCGLYGFVYILSFCLVYTKDLPQINVTNDTVHRSNHSERFKVIDWKFNSLKTYFIFSFFIIIVVLMKISYFHIPKLSTYIPESCILVITGVIFGIIVKFLLESQSQAYFKLNTHLFFTVLLPPIILEASYSLYHRNFLDNLLSILVFAVFGTLLNFLIIGMSLWGLSRFGAMKNLNLDLLHCLLFSSLIVAVDPVAVLAIFQDVGVNPDLYYLVFGESLLNDAVTVVLYEMMQEFALMKEIGALNIGLGFISFFTVSLGGMLIGIMIGVISCLIIRMMTAESTLLLEPILLISTGYMSYLCGDVFGWSGIISTIACGLIQASYAFYSISDKSRLVLKRFVKILSAICEALIFLFLGVELVVGDLEFDTSFSICSLFLCLITRFVVTFALSGLINKIHISLRSIPLREKIIISYGGLRGAVAFSLAVLINPNVLPSKGINGEIIITTSLFIILFTIFVQGITVKPLVNVLQITKKTHIQRLSLLDELNESVFEATTCGIDSILGKCGQDYFFMLIERFNAKYLRPILQGNSSNSFARMVALNEKINHAIVSGLKDQQPTHSLHKTLPNSYLNLMTLLSQSNKAVHKPKVIARRKTLYQHTTSDVLGYQGLRPVQRLQPFLIRASIIPYHEESPHLQETFEENETENRDKFLSFRQSRRHRLNSLAEHHNYAIEDEENRTEDSFF